MSLWLNALWLRVAPQPGNWQESIIYCPSVHTGTYAWFNYSSPIPICKCMAHNSSFLFLGRSDWWGDWLWKWPQNCIFYYKEAIVPKTCQTANCKRKSKKEKKEKLNNSHIIKTKWMDYLRGVNHLHFLELFYYRIFAIANPIRHVTNKSQTDQHF